MSLSNESTAGSRRRLILILAFGGLCLGVGFGLGRMISPDSTDLKAIDESGKAEAGNRTTRPIAATDVGTGTSGDPRPAANPPPSSLITVGQDSGLGAALGQSNPPLREAALLKAGFDLAEANLASAISQLENIESQSDRDAFLRGVFAFAASARSVGEVFKLAAGLEGEDRATALFAALDTLSSGRKETRERAENFTERFGVEAGVGLALSLDEVYRPGHANDWMTAFGDTDSAGIVMGSLASLRADEDFEQALALGAHLTGWDREMFFRAFGDGWSQRSPGDAWEWAREHAANSGPGGTPILAKILRNWGRNDFAAAQAAFNELTDPEQRLLGANELAKVQTWDSGTAEAVRWANQLPTEAEKDAAHAAIAEFSPQGIGVALGLEDGFAVINKVVPDSVADRDGTLQQGDRIVEVDPGTGQFQTIYGRELTQAVNLIRGDSGSRLRLRVVRQDENGNFRDQIVELTREQLVLEATEGG